MHQTEYAFSILHQFNMEHCAPSHTPLPEGMILPKDTTTPYIDPTVYTMLVSKLLFLTKIRPDLTHIYAKSSGDALASCKAQFALLATVSRLGLFLCTRGGKPSAWLYRR